MNKITPATIVKREAKEVKVSARSMNRTIMEKACSQAGWNFKIW